MRMPPSPTGSSLEGQVVKAHAALGAACLRWRLPPQQQLSNPAPCHSLTAGDPQRRCWGRPPPSWPASLLLDEQMHLEKPPARSSAPLACPSRKPASTAANFSPAVGTKVGFPFSLPPGRTTPHSPWHFLVLRTYHPGATFPRLMSPPIYLKN